MYKKLAIFKPSLTLKQKLIILSRGTTPPLLRKPWKILKCPLPLAKSLLRTCYVIPHPQFSSYIVHAAYAIREFSKLRPLAIAWYIPAPHFYTAARKIKHPGKLVHLYAAFEIPDDGRINFNDFISRSIALLDRTKWDTLISWPYAFNTRLCHALTLAGAIPHPEHIKQPHLLLGNYFLKQNCPQAHKLLREIKTKTSPKATLLEKILYTMPLKPTKKSQKTNTK
jgi:hypothetical protein